MSDNKAGGEERKNQSTGAQIQLKVELFHDVRNRDKKISDIENRVKELLNHPNEKVTHIRISVGYEASAVFLNLRRKRWHHKNVERIVRRLAKNLESSFYADNIRVRNWYLDTDE